MKSQHWEKDLPLGGAMVRPTLRRLCTTSTSRNLVGKYIALGALALTPSRGTALSNPVQQAPVRRVAIGAQTREPLGIVLGVKEFSNGNVLVNDAGQRRLLLCDSSLRIAKVVADSAPGSSRSYGLRPAPLMPFPGDSAFFVDVASRTLVMFGPAGDIIHVTALPHVADMPFVTGYPSSVDAMGHLLYRSGVFAPNVGGAGIAAPPAALASADSAPLVRASFDSRRLDTVATIKVSGVVLSASTVNAAGERTSRLTVRPYTWIDDWTTQPDGTIAIIRGQDYHVDFIRPDGSTTSGPRLPFDWKRLSDDEKRALADHVLDSLRAVEAEHIKSGLHRRSTMNFATGEVRDLGPAPPREFQAVPLSEMPDYYPPVRTGAMRSDPEGQLWVLPSTSARAAAGGLIYDVIRPTGTLLERVELPPDYSIAGFGRGGRLYVARKAPTGWVLAQAKVVR